jgi:hypothetical protein
VGEAQLWTTTIRTLSPKLCVCTRVRSFVCTPLNPGLKQYLSRCAPFVGQASIRMMGSRFPAVPHWPTFAAPLFAPQVEVSDTTGQCMRQRSNGVIPHPVVLSLCGSISPSCQTEISSELQTATVHVWRPFVCLHV